jgi:hypothetical protein
MRLVGNPPRGVESLSLRVFSKRIEHLVGSHREYRAETDSSSGSSDANGDADHVARTRTHCAVSGDAGCVRRPIAIRSDPGEGLNGTAGSHVRLAS